MALSADAIINERALGNKQIDEAVIATGSQIYLGGLVNIRTTTGRALPASAATGRRFGGIAVEFVGPDADGLGDTAGTEKVRIAYGHEVELTVDTAIRTNTTLGLNLFVDADDKVAGTDVGTAGTRIAVGEAVAWSDEDGSDKSKAWVALKRFAKTDIAV